MRTKRLFTATDIGLRLGISKQAVNKQLREGRIEQPEYVVGKTNAWTLEQFEKITRGLK
jgi:hypothetical protein